MFTYSSDSYRNYITLTLFLLTRYEVIKQTAYNWFRTFFLSVYAEDFLNLCLAVTLYDHYFNF